MFNGMTHQVIFMEKGHHHHDPKEFSARMKACGVPDRVQEYMIRCTEFHTAPAPGVLIGAIMVDYALELLEANPEEKLFAVCETPKCLPDTLQVIAHSTTGNGRLTVLPIGKFAITVNRASDSSTAEGVRVWVDSEKLKKFPGHRYVVCKQPAIPETHDGHQPSGRDLPGKKGDPLYRTGAGASHRQTEVETCHLSLLRRECA